jgi:sugar lactone lactonase YvrE
VVRVAPDGKVDRVVEMPADNVTTCTFGGPALRTLYITSAGHGRPDPERSAQVPAGALMECRVDVPGLPVNSFREA